MAKQECLTAVKTKNPPTVCTDSYCWGIQAEIDAYCHDAGKRDWTPIPQYDPNLNGPGQGGKCYCCCSCLAYETPIEQTPGEFILAADVRPGTVILAAGVDLDWRPSPVEITSGWLSDKPLRMYYLTYLMPDEEVPRRIICTADHLFLVEGDLLKNVQSLVPGERLRAAHGEAPATVVFVWGGDYVGGVRAIQMGEFDGKSLDGHLLSTNGIVTADFAVQVAYHSDTVAPELLAPEEKGAPRQAAYLANLRSTELQRFLATSDEHPEQFIPLTGRLINPPVKAKRMVTPRQAEDIRQNSDPSDPRNAYPAEPALYLFRLYNGFFPDVTFILDWNNDDANAYTWYEFGKKMVVVTGGLARAKGFDRDGMALVLAVMLAFDEQTTCVGPADYRAVQFYLRYIFDSDLFFTVMESALPQMETLFGYIDPANRVENPDDICDQPSTECRMKTYRAAYSMFGVPACAVPPPVGFSVTGAVMNAPNGVQVTFNAAVDPPSAETKRNYTIRPYRAVLDAKVDPASPKAVDITTSKPFSAGTEYTITVQNVVSDGEAPLDPRHRQATFTTPDAAADGQKAMV